MGSIIKRLALNDRYTYTKENMYVYMIVCYHLSDGCSPTAKIIDNDEICQTSVFPKKITNFGEIRTGHTK